jgi:hypothetical protein
VRTSEFRLTTGGVRPLSIDGDTGTAGEVLTSQGPGLPPMWAPGGGGGGFSQPLAFVADGTRFRHDLPAGAHGLGVGHFIIQVTEANGALRRIVTPDEVSYDPATGNISVWVTTAAFAGTISITKA